VICEAAAPQMHVQKNIPKVKGFFDTFHKKMKKVEKEEEEEEEERRRGRRWIVYSP